MDTPGYTTSEPETLTGSNSAESLTALDDVPIKFQDDPGLDIDITGPQFTQVSFRYFNLEHPVRRLCIKILLSP